MSEIKVFDNVNGGTIVITIINGEFVVLAKHEDGCNQEVIAFSKEEATVIMLFLQEHLK